MRSVLRNEEKSDAERVTLIYFVELLRNRAAAGQIIVYGKLVRSNDGSERAIPADYWRYWTIDVDALLRSRFSDNPSTIPTTSTFLLDASPRDVEYTDLMIKRSVARRLVKDTWRAR